MKNKILIIATLAGSLALSSCEDFLTHDNTTSANQETFFDTDEALEAATAPLYNYVWNSFNDKAYYSMGDGRANNITARWSDYIYPYTNFTETALSPGLEDAWGSFYSVVAQSNYAINNIKDYSGPQVSEKAKVQAYAEARFMRGLAYWYIGSLWNKGIIYENTAEQVNNSVVPANRGVDVIEFAIRDLEYAAVNLSKTASDVGRVTCYSAYAILSRMYLSMAGLTTEGEYNGSNIATDFNRDSRNTYYLDMARKAATKVIEEGPYSLLDNYGDLFAPSTCNNNSEAIFQLQWLQGSTDAIGWGCNNSISTYFGWSTMVSEQNWGNATETGYDNKCNFKKYVIGKIDDNGQSYAQSSGMNTYMMRLAEVYLNLAEAILGNNASTSEQAACDAFNAVRKRAGMPSLTTITYSDIHYERRIELALEGQYWYDLLRRSYYQQQEVVNYLNSQERNAGYEWDETEACQYAKTSDGTGVSTATSANLTLPISDVDRGRNPLLNNDPVAYEFGAKEVTENDLFND